MKMSALQPANGHKIKTEASRMEIELIKNFYGLTNIFSSDDKIKYFSRRWIVEDRNIIQPNQVLQITSISIRFSIHVSLSEIFVLSLAIRHKMCPEQNMFDWMILSSIDD